MPEMDRLLDDLIADVKASTQAPGASTAIKQAHRRRAKITAAVATVAVAVIAAAGGLAAATLDGNDRPSPSGEPSPPSPDFPMASPLTPDQFAGAVQRTLVQVPNWAITDDDPTIVSPC